MPGQDGISTDPLRCRGGSQLNRTRYEDLSRSLARLFRETVRSAKRCLSCAHSIVRFQPLGPPKGSALRWGMRPPSGGVAPATVPMGSCTSSIRFRRCLWKSASDPSSNSSFPRTPRRTRPRPVRPRKLFADGCAVGVDDERGSSAIQAIHARTKRARMIESTRRIMRRRSRDWPNHHRLRTLLF